MNLDLMLDSGAFSAWKGGGAIDIEGYRDFCLEHRDVLGTIVSLDCIPGRFGNKPTPKQLGQATRRSIRNALYLREAGLDVMPVYHFGEPLDVLDRYLEEGFEYVGLGGLVNVHWSARRGFLDRTFERLCGRGGYPAVRTHLFGVMDWRVLTAYPAYSFDSAKWALYAAFGQIFIPRFSPDGGFDFDQPPSTLFISRRDDGGASSKAARADFGHFDRLGRATRDSIVCFIEEAGQTLEGVRSDARARSCVTIAYYSRLAARVRIAPFRAARTPSIFPDAQDGPEGRRTPLSEGLLPYWSVSPSRGINERLTAIGEMRRLVSYFPFSGHGKSKVRFDTFLAGAK